MPTNSFPATGRTVLASSRESAAVEFPLLGDDQLGYPHALTLVEFCASFYPTNLHDMAVPISRSRLALRPSRAS